ncbi:hypothetical protein RRG08_002128 [Elysia crispata]|uniref:Uncharacterized protein n=1 Tax=Elysia crispata TaxID=231223 RepID=A0AAE1D4C5_9GAST|nr:hypothetical protein RRG08_002128 [Elysia crispata]
MDKRGGSLAIELEGNIKSEREILASNSTVSTEEDLPIKSIVLSARDIRKMYPGSDTESERLEGHKVSMLRDTRCIFTVVKDASQEKNRPSCLTLKEDPPYSAQFT